MDGRSWTNISRRSKPWRRQGPQEAPKRPPMRPPRAPHEVNTMAPKRPPEPLHNERNKVGEMVPRLLTPRLSRTTKTPGGIRGPIFMPLFIFSVSNRLSPRGGDRSAAQGGAPASL